VYLTSVRNFSKRAKIIIVAPDTTTVSAVIDSIPILLYSIYMDDVNHNNMNGVRYKTGIYYYNDDDDDDDDGHGKCSCWSQNNFFVVLVCISVFLNGYLYHVHNMLPSKNNIMTRSSNPTKTATNSNTLYTEFTKGLSSMNVSTATIPPTKLSALTVTATLATTMDTTMDTSMNATDDDCNVTSISSGSTYHFEATAKYRQSKTLPKWMIGTHLYGSICFIFLVIHQTS
jgi:hypothetical protein